MDTAQAVRRIGGRLRLSPVALRPKLRLRLLALLTFFTGFRSVSGPLFTRRLGSRLTTRLHACVAMANQILHFLPDG